MTGHCANKRVCSIASAGRAVLLRPEDRFVCPQCGAPLSAAPATRRARIVVLGGLGLASFMAMNVAAFGIGHFFVANGVAVLEAALRGPNPTAVRPRLSDHASLTGSHTKMNPFPG
jgi:hypothetical protein